MSLHLVVAVTRRRQPNARLVRCSAAQESVFTRNGDVMETPTARMAAMKPTVVCKAQLASHTLKMEHFNITVTFILLPPADWWKFINVLAVYLK